MKIHGHDHEITSVIGYLRCQVCGDQSNWYRPPGFRCGDCEFFVESKCAFVFSIVETLEHPSHVGHILKLLTKGAPDHTDPKCHICCKITKRLLYHCTTCELNMDIDCMMDGMCARAHLKMPWHHHPLLMLDFGYEMRCKVCGLSDGYGYFCPHCRLPLVHEKCVSVVFETPEINHHFHGRHSLKLLTDGAPSYANQQCHVCGKHIENFLYHCDICKFNLDMICALEYHNEHKHTPLALSNLKVHEHILTLIPRLISFVCDACGTKGDLAPYVCLHQSCDLMFFHQSCARLPRVINVNRHDHRVSYKYPIGLGDWDCRICLDKVDWSYGAYFCSLCPDYTLHSRCATSKDVWDGEELDGVPEEIEDIEPFKVNDDNTITHFAHKHNISLKQEDGTSLALEESILCVACARPIESYTFYYCSDCSFIIHETCANLPKKKRHFLSPRPLILLHNEDNIEKKCSACFKMCCTGFMYADGNAWYDLECSSISMPFIHDSHPHHPLLYLKLNFTNRKTCSGCRNSLISTVLGCTKCDYYLDFSCASLPLTVRLGRYDDHPLTLCYGEKASGKYWCDICERETNPETWFYTCNDCGVTLHVYCVLGNVKYAKPGGMIRDGFQLQFNNTSSRPLCDNCHCRCPAPFFLTKEKKLYCSYYCVRLTRSRAYRTSSMGTKNSIILL